MALVKNPKTKQTDKSNGKGKARNCFECVFEDPAGGHEGLRRIYRASSIPLRPPGACRPVLAAWHRSSERLLQRQMR